MERLQDYICFQCAEKLEHPLQVCPKCQYDNSRRETEAIRPENSLLKDGQYYVGRRLGQGGFGITYIGREMKNLLKRRIAIKEYFPSAVATRSGDKATVQPAKTFDNSGDSTVKQFERGKQRTLEEAQRVSGLNNEKSISDIVNVYDVFEENGTVYIIMQYIEGKTLANMVQKKTMTAQEAYDCLLPIMQALQRIHESGIIHRDVSPENIMCRSSDGRAVLLDFGAAKDIRLDNEHMTATLRPGYAPPEQYISSAQQDARIDEYALCATMYFLLTGKTPPNANQRSIMEGKTVLAGDLKDSLLAMPDSVPQRVQKVIYKGMSLNAKDRYDSVADFQAALYEALNDKPKPRMPKLLFVGVAAIIVLGAGAFFVLGGQETAQPEQTQPAQTRLAQIQPTETQPIQTQTTQERPVVKKRNVDGQMELDWEIENAKSYTVSVKNGAGEEIFSLVESESSHAVAPAEVLEDCTVEVKAYMYDDTELLYTD